MIAPGDTPFSRALSWSYALTGSRVVVSLLVSLVLARLLGPEPFGLVAMGLAFIAVVELLVKQGLTATIVQRVDLRPSHLDAAFWMTVATIVLLTPVALIASGWWARINQTPELEPVLLALSVLVPLRGLSVVQEATILRDLDFRLLAIRTATATVLGGVLGLAAALAGAGVWALVVQHLTAATVELLLVWSLGTWRPSLRFQRSRARELLGFSGKTTAAALSVFLQRQADALLIGLFFGPVVVGLYRMASRLVSVALEVASSALQSAFLPELSRHQGDDEAFRRRTLELLRVSALLAVPLLGGLIAVARPLLALLGDDWEAAVVAIQLMAILAILHALAIFTGPILQAAGRPGTFAVVTAFTGALSALTMVGAGVLITATDPERQVTLIAATRTVVLSAAFALVVVPVLRRVVGLRPAQLLWTLAPASAAAVLGVGGTAALQRVAEGRWPATQGPALLLTGTSYVLLTLAGLVLFEPRVRALIATAGRRYAPPRRRRR